MNAWCSTRERRFALGGVALAMLLAFTVFRPPATPGPVERDFEAYYSAGATVNAGGDPYSRAIWDLEAHIPGVTSTRDEVLPFVGPAAGLPWWTLLARLPYRPAAAVWAAILLGAYLILVTCTLRLARRPLDPLTVTAGATFTLAAAPMLADFALGQVALVSAAAVAAALLAYDRRTVAGALIATLLAAAQPNVALSLVARMRSRWDLGVAGTAAAAFAALALAAGGGIAGAAAYAARLHAHGEAERFVTIQHTPAAVAFSWGATPATAATLGAAIALIAIVLTASLIIRERLDPTTATLVSCAALPLAVPFFHEHDFVLLLVPLLVLALRAEGRARALAGVAATLILVDWFGLAQRHFAQGQIVCLGVAVAASFIALTPPHDRAGRRSTSASFGALATLVLVAAIAVPMSRHHPAPTWPDMLPSTYRAPAGADASAVWADEAHAAGLDARDPVWGALRALPLAGSLFLGIALVADRRARRRLRAGPSPTATIRADVPVPRATIDVR